MTNPTTAARTRPIIFDAESVRAILAGTKTQTRRVIRGEFVRYEEGWSLNGGHPKSLREDWCQYLDGDHMWVREVWTEHDDQYGSPHIIYAADGASAHIGADEGPGRTLINERILYVPKVQRDSIGLPDSWRSPYDMPRWASRITLEVLSVKVERVRPGCAWKDNPWVFVITFRRLEVA